MSLETDAGKPTGRPHGRFVAYAPAVRWWTVVLVVACCSCAHSSPAPTLPAGPDVQAICREAVTAYIEGELNRNSDATAVDLFCTDWYLRAYPPDNQPDPPGI